MITLDERIVSIKQDAYAIELLIKQYEFYILKCASKTSKHFIHKSDDEWSIALFAFAQAIQSFDSSRGHFLTYAQKVIHNQLIDYYKSQGKYSHEIHVPWFEDHAMIQSNDDYLKLEIEAITDCFLKYGFDFMDLTSNSPKAKKTKIACAKAVIAIIEHPLVYHEMQRSLLLPIKIIENMTKVPRKILERHRKYIIAASEILMGDYPYLSEYVNCLREEAKL